MRGRVIAFVVSMSAALAFCERGATAAVTINKVAFTGQTAPGTTGGATFQQFGIPVINGNGNVAVYAQIGGGSVTGANDVGLWLKNPNGLALVVREGDLALPPSTSIVFQSLPGGSSLPAIDTFDKVAFLGIAADPSIPFSNFGGIWSTESGAVASILRKGDPAPGLAGVTFNEFVSVVVNVGGKMIFASNLSTGEESIWARANLVSSLVARTGDPAPGTTAAFAGFVADYAQINQDGRTIMQAVLDDNGQGIWTNRNGPLELLARTDVAVPEANPGEEFVGFGLPVLNPDGKVIVTGSLIDSFDASTGFGVWLDRNDATGLHLIAREGSAVPGAAGLIFETILNAILDDVGHVTLFATMQGAGVAVWSDRSGSPGGIVVKPGDAARGFAAGVKIGAITGFTMNGMGRAALSASLVGPGINSTNNSALWLEDITQQFRPVLQTGNTLQIGLGDIRTIASIMLPLTIPYGDGRGTILNGAGELVVSLGFTDGTSGIVVCTVSGSDADGDGIDDPADNCPNAANPDQTDADSDGRGDACDNCPSAANTNQADADSDGRGDACDNCPSTPNTDQTNSDSDGLGNACDNCDNTSNPDQADCDGDGIGDSCEADNDSDGRPNDCDNCPNTANANQADANGNGVGDACEPPPDPNNPNPPDPGEDPNEEPPPANPMGCGGCGAGTASITSMMLPLLVLAKAARRRSRRAGR